jgi:hypothetical protein
MPNQQNDPPLNPYEAPQTCELPSAAFVEPRVTSTSLVSPPPEVQRWMKASIVLYFVSFVVPYAPWVWSARQDWHIGIGTILSIFGLFFFWNPYMISWWANLTLWLAYRDLNRLNSGRALGFAIAGMCLAPVIGVLELIDPYIRYSNGDLDELLPNRLLFSAPYLCWFGSILLMLIAAIKLRLVLNSSEESFAARQG